MPRWPANLSRGGKRSSLALDSDLEDEGLFDDRILGGGDFCARVLSLAGQTLPETKPSLEEILEQIAAYFGIEKSHLKRPGKERSLVRARAVLCYVAVRELGIKGVVVAQALACTPGAVSHAARRGEEILRQETELQRILDINL